MYVRSAYLEGDVALAHREHFETQINDVIAPMIAGFPGCRGVRLLWAREYQEGAPRYYLVIEHFYDSLEAIAAALVSAERDRMWAVLEPTMALFEGTLTHINQAMTEVVPRA